MDDISNRTYPITSTQYHVMSDFTYKNIGLEVHEEQAIADLLLESENDPPQVEDIWKLMDMVWEQYGCDNDNLLPEKIIDFYNHPVWILNGLFIEQDAASMQHRQVISDWIVQKGMRTVLDYGGGFGTLAKLIGEKNPMIKVDIYEPHPSNFALKKTHNYPNINFISSISKEYDCLVSTDVLEHVPDPLSELYEMQSVVKDSGYLILANCFYPVMHCHLPANFHLRYTFNLIAKVMGLEVVGVIQDNCATIFRKKYMPHVNWSKLKIVEAFSKFICPWIELTTHFYKKLMGK